MQCKVIQVNERTNLLGSPKTNFMVFFKKNVDVFSFFETRSRVVFDEPFDFAK